MLLTLCTLDTTANDRGVSDARQRWIGSDRICRDARGYGVRALTSHFCREGAPCMALALPVRQSGAGVWGHGVTSV